jgi:hypothetical protein
VRDKWLQQVLQHFKVQPTIDELVTAANTKCAKSFSKSPQPGTEGVYFFAWQLKPGEVYFSCSPVKLTAHCMQKIVASQNITALLLVPHWTSSVY